MSGGKRENCVAKPKPATRKLQRGYRMAQYIDAWLKHESERVGKSQAVIIEEALVAQHNLESFKNEWIKS